MANKFAADGDPKTLGEIYAYGFRNAHRLSWDLTDGTMFASDIGMNNIEEINIVRNGENYGWMKREGYLENGTARPRRRAERAVSAAGGDPERARRRTASPIRSRSTTTTRARRSRDGFAYHGAIAALRGKFVFGDIQRGRVFAADLAAMKKADDGIPQTVAPIEEIQLYVRDASGNRDVRDAAGARRAGRWARRCTRADLHIGRSRDGELFITSRQDGMIRMLVPDDAPATR